MHWYWIEPDRLAGGSCPSPRDLPRLQNRGFGTILSLLKDPRQYAYEPRAAKERFAWYNVPMTDHRTPDINSLVAVHERLRSDRDSQVLVHCYAGIGRTGLVALSHLMAKGVPQSEATRQVDDWTGDTFSWEIRSRREEVRRLLREFLTQWPTVK